MKLNKTARYFIGTAFILTVPYAAMRISDEVQWDVMDFVVIGALLLGTGLLFELISSRVNSKYRGVIVGVLLAVMLLIWIELAVGLFGSPLAGS